MKQPKTEKLQIRATGDFIDRLNRAAGATDRPAAQIVREAIGEKLDELAKQFPQINEPAEADRSLAAAA